MSFAGRVRKLILTSYSCFFLSVVGQKKRSALFGNDELLANQTASESHFEQQELYIYAHTQAHNDYILLLRSYKMCIFTSIFLKAHADTKKQTAIRFDIEINDVVRCAW